MTAREMRREAKPRVGLSFRLVALVLLALALVAALWTPVASAQTDSSFPAPLIAPVASEDSDNPAAITAFYRDPAAAVAEPLFLVDLHAAVSELPEGTRISVLTGDPAGTRQRSSLYLDAGGPRGDTEQGNADGFTSVQPGDVAITDDGLARIRLATVPDSDLVWAETETPDGQLSTSPIFPLSQVTGASGPGALTAAEVATVRDADSNPTGEFVPLSAVPTLEVLNQDITVRTTQPVPTNVNGVPVATVRDFLRVAPDVASSGEAPYFVVIDYTQGTITYFDATGGIPVEVGADRSTWLVDDLTGDDAATTSVTFDRAGFLAAIGREADAPVALGVSRAVILEDGRYLQAEGALGTLQWFDDAGGEVSPSTTAEVTTTAPLPTAVPDDAALDDEGADATVVIVAAVIAAGLAGIALFAARQNRRAYADPDAALGAMATVVDKTAQDHDDEGDTDAERASPRPARSGVRAPSSAPAEPVTVADAVGVAGARAAVSREAQARAAAEEVDGSEPAADAGPGPDHQAGDEASDTDAVWAAMRRKAAEAHSGGDADASRPESSRPRDETVPGAGKTTRPDDALDALNRVIDDLQLPDEH
jgi:hypothetical protein